MGLVALKNEDLPHYTYDDYVQWEGRWEIINGIPYAMYPAPSKKHQRVSLKIARQLEDFHEGKIIFDLGNEGCRIAFDFSKIF